MKFAGSSLRRAARVCLPLGLLLWSSTGFGANATVSGQLVGRSGKPLAGAWVSLGRVTQDEGKDAKVELTDSSAVTDDGGRFTLANVPPGDYTLVYQPAPAKPVKGLRPIPVRDLSRMMRSFMPMLRDTEVGVREPFPDRTWTSDFTLLKGHTLYCISIGGAYMKIWNATVRNGRQGPYLEMRKNQLWKQKVQGNTQVKFQAWSY